MCTKMYIFQCAAYYNKINIMFFQKEFKSSFYKHLTLLKLKDTNKKHNQVHKWSLFNEV